MIQSYLQERYINFYNYIINNHTKVFAVYLYVYTYICTNGLQLKYKGARLYFDYYMNYNIKYV